MSTPKTPAPFAHHHASNFQRAIVWAEQQLAEQNQSLRDALEGAPEFAQVLASVCRPTAKSSRVRPPVLGQGRA